MYNNLSHSNLTLRGNLLLCCLIYVTQQNKENIYSDPQYLIHTHRHIFLYIQNIYHMYCMCCLYLCIGVHLGNRLFKGGGLFHWKKGFDLSYDLLARLPILAFNVHFNSKDVQRKDWTWSWKLLWEWKEDFATPVGRETEEKGGNPCWLKGLWGCKRTLSCFAR